MRINKLMTKIVLAILVLGVILGNIGVVNAATGSVTFTPSSQTVKAGDTFDIIMSATCDTGISGVEANYSFDTEKLEFVESAVTSSKWTSLGTDGLITVIDNSSETKTSEDLFKLTFKVKDGVQANSTLQVQFTNIKLYQDGSSSDEVDVPATQTVSITVGSNSPTPTQPVTPTPTQPTTPTQPVTPTPTQPTTPSTTTPTPSTSPSVTPSPSASPTGREVIVYTDDDNTTNTTSKNATKNESKSGSTLPYTGMSSFIVIGLVVVIISAVGLYFANRKYRGL